MQLTQFGVTEMAGALKATVSELLEIFRESLIAVLPSMERADIRWKKGESYDEWDKISEALFVNIVARSLYWELKETRLLDSILPAYDSIRMSYDDVGLLRVDFDGGYGYFMGLTTQSIPFDTVQLVALDNRGRPLPEERLQCRFVDATFRYLPNWRDKNCFIEKVDI